MRFWPALLPLAAALGQAPSFRADRVIPSGGERPVALAPGMLVSIYGEHLGPADPCTGKADTARRETPNPARPYESFAETLIYPAELCGVQVFVGGRPAGLLYVSAPQINFKVPQDVAEGAAEVKVMYGGESHAEQLRVGIDGALLAVEAEARVDGPVWLHIEMPWGWNGMVQYPVSIVPDDFGCNVFEVRHKGEPVAPIKLEPVRGGVAGSLVCGNLGFEHPVPHGGRLPLHLKYRFTEPGDYEVRYTRTRGYPKNEVMVKTAWTAIRILPRAPRPLAGPAPSSAEELLSDYLPSLLGFGDRAGLDAVVAALYHPSSIVRRFAANALRYWPEAETNARVDRELAARGPTDVTVEDTLTRHPELAKLTVSYLSSDDPVLLRGAVTGLRRQPSTERELIDAAEHVVRIADPQTVTDYTAALGTLHDGRATALLWSFVERDIARSQSLIALTWRKDLRDLPRLARYMDNSLPYALLNAYGDAARPYVENAMKNSPDPHIRESCARELANFARR